MPETPALPRWWREPWWARATLAGILALFAVLTLWNLARGGDFAFYEASARSMSQSPQALLFGAFDPSGTVTLDKLSGFAVPQALSIRLFGMSTSSLALPQVIEGLVTVFACGLIGLRWLGRTGGLMAAAAAAATPIFVSMFAHPMEDGLVTMALAVAVLWWQRAMLTARWWPLLLAGVFVGVGFQAKMMQAWFVLPALVVGTIIGFSGRRRRRVAAAAVVLGSGLAASLSWMLVMQLFPASSRPFVDGSTDNDVFAMVFGYNGIDRLFPNAIAGAVHSGGGLPGASGASAALTKLVEPIYLSQIGWLYPAALIGVVVGAAMLVRGRSQSSRRALDGPLASRVGRATYIALSVWLLTGVGILSAARMPHTAYLSAIGVQLALFAALATSEALRLRASSSALSRATLPVLVVVQGAWVVVLGATSTTPTPLLVSMAVVVVLGAVASIVWAWRANLRRPMTKGGRRLLAAAAAIAIVAGPAAYSLQVIDPVRDGSGGDAYVGIKPAAGTSAVVVSSRAAHRFTPAAPLVWGGTPALAPSLVELLSAVRSAGGGANGAPLFLTDSWSIAAPIIDATGQEVLTDGGYSGQATVFTVPQIEARIVAGVHLIVVSDGTSKSDPVKKAVSADSCTPLRSWSAAGRGAGSRDDASPRAFGQHALGFTLYSCA